jgi:hypothetical protein
MATTAGIKDLSWATVDGGSGAPSLLATAGGDTTGSTIDLFDTVNNLLPDEVALRIGLKMTTTATTAVSGAATPTYQVYALWLTAATTGTPVANDKESDLLAVHTDTTTITNVTVGSPYNRWPTNPRVFATKARYLKLFYKINAVGNIAGNLSFGADYAGIFGKTEG